MWIDHGVRLRSIKKKKKAYLLVLDAEALVLLLQQLDLRLELADVGLFARAGAGGGLAVLDQAFLAAVGAPTGAGPSGARAEAHIVLQRGAGVESRGDRVETVGQEGRRRRGRARRIAEAAVRGEDAAGVVGLGAAVRGGRGEEVEVGVEAELRGDEACAGGAGGLQRGRAGAGGVGPYVFVVVHAHGRHQVGRSGLLSACLFWARSGAPHGHRGGRLAGGL
jgi:hypothetical protein